MTREIRLSVLNAGILKLTPLVFFLWAVWKAAGVRYFKKEEFEFLLGLGRALPLAGFIFPALSLREAVSESGGDIHFVYRKSRGYWAMRNLAIILPYALITGAVMAILLIWALGEIRWPALWVVMVVTFFYGWLAYFSMLWTKDIMWTSLICLVVSVFGVFAPPGLIDLINVSQGGWMIMNRGTPWPLIALYLGWSAICAALGTMRIRRF